MFAVSGMKSFLTPTFSAFPKPTPLALFSFASKSHPCNSTTFRHPSFLPLKPAIFSPKSSFLSMQNRGMHVELAPPSSTGEIHVIVGPMFSGKTTSLLRRIQSESSNGRFWTFLIPVSVLNAEFFSFIFRGFFIKCCSSRWVVFVFVSKMRYLSSILDWVI